MNERITVDRDVSEPNWTGRWWTANPKARKPSHFRERGTVPEYLWRDYADAKKAERLAIRERQDAERLLNESFEPTIPAPHPEAPSDA